MKKNIEFTDEQYEWLGRAVVGISKYYKVGEIKVELLNFLVKNKRNPGNFRDISIESKIGLATVSDAVSSLIKEKLIDKKMIDNEYFYVLLFPHEDEVVLSQ